MYKGFRLNYLRTVHHRAHWSAFCFPITEGILTDASVCMDVNSVHEILQSRGTSIADGKPTTLMQIPQRNVWIRWKSLLHLHYQLLKCEILFTGGLKLLTYCKTALNMNKWKVCFNFVRNECGITDAIMWTIQGVVSSGWPFKELNQYARERYTVFG